MGNFTPPDGGSEASGVRLAGWERNDSAMGVIAGEFVEGSESVEKRRR